MLQHSTNSGRPALTRCERDLYETPSEAARALLRVEKISHCVWELDAGYGAIERVLHDQGHAAIASDIIDYGFPLHFVHDFLTITNLPATTKLILTNPPYQQAAEFVVHALKLCPRVVLLLRLAFLESDRRTWLLDCSLLARVHVFKNRLPMMHRGGWTRPQASRAISWRAS
jgi:hypothetical protein